ncbi:T9SS type A sorting domain-containing protein [Dyadobacter fanqingshengii]|uniref:T9SS type A sorting domain-containing protein n=1 Tax=Dyadobacter fanqingshengii TaxID=2906443 RepID=A0A9X1P434_9BACT|nr:T9SS type A sorting domain-containing protein [Dyadobacter fanqingshengii]MCF0038514.1 T9SS type A sorting domain-containing protein [Dyadobacter fanqingshengii]USJ34653.1 T9SS type A sorting domain-containing protein [Dyadobacter fanqingshengii]
MQHLAAFARRGRYCLLPTLLFAFSITFGQDYEQLRQQKLNSLDLSGLGQRLFLNAGVTTKHEIDHFKNLNKNEKTLAEPVSAEEWQNLYDRLVDTDLRPANIRLAELTQLIETNAAKLTSSNVVPIGIINLEGIYLSDQELAQNETSKKAGRAVDFTKYETVRIVSSAALQEDLYQAKVSFYISNALNIDNHAEKVSALEIDFNDGGGFTTYPISGQLILHEFQSIGEHRINIRFQVGSVAYTFETKVNVKQMVRYPYEEFDITAKPFSTASPEADSTARTAFVGGTIRIIKGCDEILNKPIIVAEGFDMGQDVNLDVLEARYRTPLNQFLLEGYDLVLLDYNDGRAAIQDNAQVLKAALELVNNQKSGNVEAIVIGESMSGLVARWALREMENSGQAHHVQLLMCYDTPHQGANVPVGLTQLMYDAHPTLLTKVILKFFAKGWRNYHSALGTQAARQLLLHHAGHPNVGAKHPDFDSFRTQLVNLGNGGYPANCRNIAVIHGSMNASDRVLFNTYNYGSRLLMSWTPFGLQNTNIDIHTNDLNKNSSVFKFSAWGIFSKKLGVNRKYTSSLNDDFLPGGRSAARIPNKLFNGTSWFEFCFVPTFSSIDFQGPRTTQLERELLNIENMDPTQTPFVMIYGTNENNAHVTPGTANFTNVGLAEGLLTSNPACPALPVPPIPTIAPFNTCYPFGEKRTTEDNTANITVSLKNASNGQYVHNWTVLPSNQYFTTTGDQITFQAERVDHYEVTCVRTYPNRRDLSSTATATIWVYDCNSGNLPAKPDEDQLVFADAADVWEGDFLLTTSVDSLAVFAHYFPVTKILYASLQNGTFIPRSKLKASGMFDEFAALFAENDPSNPLPVHLIKFEARAEGKNVLLSWSTSSEINSEKFIIERSASGKDWNAIGQVTAQKLSDEQKEYAFYDSNVELKAAFYRLKMVDSDSTFAYSRIENLQFDGSQSALFPNPVGIDGLLQLPEGANAADITIFDLSGVKVYEKNGAATQINVEKLSPGNYIVRIRLKDGTETSQLVVKK